MLLKKKSYNAITMRVKNSISDWPVEKLRQRCRFLRPARGRDRARAAELHQSRPMGEAIAPSHRAAQPDSRLFLHVRSPADRRSRCRHRKDGQLISETRGSRFHLPAAERDHSNLLPPAVPELLQQPSTGLAKHRIL